MSEIKCQAKNPATCRYHAPNAPDILKRKAIIAQTEYNEVLSEYLSASEKGEDVSHLLNAVVSSNDAYQSARDEYYSTPEGRKALITKINKVEDLNEKVQLEARLKTIDAKIKFFENTQLLDGSQNNEVEPEAKFALPTFTPYYSDDKITQVGSKYDERHTPQRVRAFIKQDLIKARKAGLFPKNIGFKVELDRKTNQITVEILDATPSQLFANNKSHGLKVATPSSIEWLKNANLIATAYNKTTLHYGDKDTDNSERNYSLSVGFETVWRRDARKAEAVKRQFRKTAKA